MSVSVLTSAFCSCDHATLLPNLPLIPSLHSKSFCFPSCISQAATACRHSIGHLHIKDTVCFLHLWQSLHLSQSVHLLCLASCLPFISLLSSSERQKEKGSETMCVSVITDYWHFLHHKVMGFVLFFMQMSGKIKRISQHICVSLDHRVSLTGVLMNQLKTVSDYHKMLKQIS